MVAFGQTPVTENILDLAHAHGDYTVSFQYVQQCFPGGFQREIPAAGRAGEVALARAGEGARNDPAHGMVAHQHFPGNAADAVQLFHGDHVLMAGDLKHAVTGGIHDRAAGAHMFFAQFVQNGGAAGGIIAQCLAADAAFKLVHYVLGEAVGIGRERLVQLQAHHFPVAGGGILTCGDLDGPAERARRFLRHGITQPFDPAKAHFFHIRQVRMRLFPDMAQRIRPHVAVLVRVRQCACADAVQNDHNHALHCLFLSDG